ncbi:MAG: 2-oxoglutarate ferredoxin oxidoreductase subunit alpha [Bacteroidia bacterium]|nr:MAG: 2-oxoglutarate ferredoxin oxidoreductase subunit alpha [Bacteroidia bacterium]
MKTKIKKNNIVIKFAGDSGDGIQLIGYQFTYNAAFNKTKAVNFPEFPSEIRAPRGTVAGVSSFQIHFGDENVLSVGDEFDVLVVMNAAAFKSSIKNLKKGGIIIANTDGFDNKNLKLAGYNSNPLEKGAYQDYKIFEVPIETLTLEALKDSPLTKPDKERCKNMFVLGFVSWLFGFKPENTDEFIKTKFSKKTEILEANLKALWAGYHYGNTSESIAFQYEVPEAKMETGKYRGIMGNHAIALGLVVASQKCGLPLVYCSYPITPASDILKFLSSYLNFGIKTFQAEDEIAAMCAAIGAAYGGALSVTGTSGPGLALKVESMNLAVMLELPVVIINVQRGGPSTGLPTKTEQSDLLFSLYGRPGDSFIPILAASTPSDCFYMAYEACRIALEFMTPVILLSDSYIANGAEAWKYPSVNDLPTLTNTIVNKMDNYQPYKRNENLARYWAIPGNPYTIHRIGGLEKNPETGNVSYFPEDHQKMTELRKRKIENIVHTIPKQTIDTGENTGDVLIIGWGSTYSIIKEVTNELINEGKKVSHTHLKYLYPLPENLGEIIKGFKKVIIPEMNTGQLIKVIREKYLIDAIGFNRVQGIPIKHFELKDFILNQLSLIS